MIQHSEQKIGEVWTEADHLQLVIHLRKVDELARQMVEAAVRPRGQAMAGNG